VTYDGGVKRIASCLALSLVVTASSIADAQPADGKVDAKALMQSGVRLLDAKDYLGALAVFKDAYARFQSAKILLNIGTTLNLLDRKAEAANAYQRYLDSADADPAKRVDVSAALAEIDKAVGRIEITVTPPDGEIQVNEGEWQAASLARLVRVSAGSYTVRARKAKFNTAAKSAPIASGEKTTVALALTAAPVEVAIVRPSPGGIDDTARVEAEPRSSLGAMVAAHLDVTHGGLGVLVGPTYDVSDRLEVNVCAILGPTYGAYAGASFTLVGDTARIYLAAGLPIFVSDGARVGTRAGLGIDYRLSNTLSVLAEAGGELLLNPEDDKLKIAFIPSLGLTGRL